MTKNSGLRPGTPAPKSGQYEIRGIRGGHGPERTVTKGEPLPPTPQRGQTFSLVDSSKNGAGNKK